MTNYTNLAGTSFASFQISLNGPVIYQGNNDPNVSPPPGVFKRGDLYLRHGSNNQIWSYNGSNWEDTAATFSGGTVSGNLDVTGQVSTGDPLLVLNDGEAGAGVSGGTAGLDVDRGTDPDVQWVWDEANDWWTPAGASSFVHSGVFIAEPGVPFPGGTPSYGFNGDPDTCIMSPGPDEIAFVTNDAIRWTINATGDLVPFGGGTSNIGTAVAHSDLIFGDQFRGLVGASPVYGFIGDPDTGIRSPSGDNVTIMTGNTDHVEVDSFGVLRKLGTASIETIDGSDTNAGYGFVSQPNTGMYISSGDLRILDSGADRITFQTTETTFNGNLTVRVGNGAASPALAVGGANDGLVSASTNTLGLMSNNVERLRVEANGLLTADPTGAAVPDYESLVSVGGDDSIPNKRWVLDNLGSASAAGSNTEIQYNNGGALGASADFTWNDISKTLTFGASSTITSAGSLTISSTATGGSGIVSISAGPEGNVAIAAGTGNGATTGGAVTINAGDAGSGGAGSIDILAGSGSAADTSPNGANATLQGGGADTGGTGGRARLVGGGGAVTGGDVILTPGSGTGTDGTVRLEPQAVGQSAPELRLEEDYGGSNTYVGLKAPASVAVSRTWVLPQDDPSSMTAGNLFVHDPSGNINAARGNSNYNYPILPTYTLAGLPIGAFAIRAGLIYVQDANGSNGAIAFYNGTIWVDPSTGVAVA